MRWCVFVRITDPSQKENLGIVVQYKVKVRLLLGFGSRLVLTNVLENCYYDIISFIESKKNLLVFSETRNVYNCLRC